MAAGAVSSVRDTPHDVRWKWLLLALCAVGFGVMFATIADTFALGGRPWFGWWDVYPVPRTSREVRLGFLTQPMASRPIALVIHRGTSKSKLAPTGIEPVIEFAD